MKIANIVEALIFAADAPLKPEQILEVLGKEPIEGIELTADLVEEILGELAQKYASEDFPFELRRIDGGAQFFTKREYYSFVRHAAVVASKKKLSRSTLETLAIIAYRQPVTKPEVEYVRGVNCDHAVQKLLEKKLIEIKGRSDAPGKPLIYATSPFFMEYFGLNTLADLPKLQEFSIDEEEYKKQFENYVAEQEGPKLDQPADENTTQPADEITTEPTEEIANLPIDETDSANGSGETEAPADSIQIKAEDEDHAGEEE